MKICKIKLIKHYATFPDRTECHNTTPEGYDAEIMNIISYDEEPLNEGDNVGYCIATVPDDFVFTEDMMEISKIEADSFIDVEADRILSTFYDQETGKQVDLKGKYKKRKLAVAEQLLINETVAGRKASVKK